MKNLLLKNKKLINGNIYMAFTEKQELRNVKGISEKQKEKISDFLQGAIYCWCKNRKEEWFSLRELMGGDNFYWQGTPLIPLYEKHMSKSSSAVKDAGKDAGWLLKSVIHNDKRVFETKVEARIRQYRWVGGNDDI